MAGDRRPKPKGWLAQVAEPGPAAKAMTEPPGPVPAKRFPLPAPVAGWPFQVHDSAAAQMPRYP